MKYSIGIDIGGTNTCFGLVNENAEIIYQSAIKTKDFPILEDYLTILVKQIKDLIAHCPEPEAEIRHGGLPPAFGGSRCIYHQYPPPCFKTPGPFL